MIRVTTEIKSDGSWKRVDALPLIHQVMEHVPLQCWAVRELAMQNMANASVIKCLAHIPSLRVIRLPMNLPYHDKDIHRRRISNLLWVLSLIGHSILELHSPYAPDKTVLERLGSLERLVLSEIPAYRADISYLIRLASRRRLRAFSVVNAEGPSSAAAINDTYFFAPPHSTLSTVEAYTDPPLATVLIRMFKFLRKIKIRLRWCPEISDISEILMLLTGASSALETMDISVDDSWRTSLMPLPGVPIPGPLTMTALEPILEVHTLLVLELDFPIPFALTPSDVSLMLTSWPRLKGLVLCPNPKRCPISRHVDDFSVSLTRVMEIIADRRRRFGVPLHKLGLYFDIDVEPDGWRETRGTRIANPHGIRTLRLGRSKPPSKMWAVTHFLAGFCNRECEVVLDDVQDAQCSSSASCVSWTWSSREWQFVVDYLKDMVISRERDIMFKYGYL